MFENSEIKITNKAGVVEIDIEGIIGIPEYWQFDNPEDKVATYAKFRDKVSQISDIKAEQVITNIRSLGGDVNDALLIHDALRSLDANIVTRCYGFVASAATIIAQAASESKREISSNALYLIHRAQSYAGGNATTMAYAADMLEKTDNRIAEVYARNSGKDISEYLTLMSENNGSGKWLTPEEARDAGLVDFIFNTTAPVNITSAEVKAMGLPDIPHTITNKQIPMKMKIKQGWTAIRNFLGLDEDRDHDVDEKRLEEVNNRLDALEGEKKLLNEAVDTKDAVIAGKEELIKAKEAEITNLTASNDALTAEIARLKALPTKTKEREDPPHNEAVKTGNNAAYDEDVKCFK